MQGLARSTSDQGFERVLPLFWNAATRKEWCLFTVPSDTTTDTRKFLIDPREVLARDAEFFESDYGEP